MVTLVNGNGKTVTGQRIAKAFRTYPSWDRAEDAVRWLKGEVQIKPTIKLAARTFCVSVPLVCQAREYLARLDEWCERIKRNGTTTLSDAALDRIVAEVGAERVIASIERGVASGVLPEVTDFRVDRVPQSLQAAE